MKKHKWILVLLMLGIELVVFIYLVKLKFKNIDMTDLRLFITYWKEYNIRFLLMLLGYLGIKKVLED